MDTWAEEQWSEFYAQLHDLQDRVLNREVSDWPTTYGYLTHSQYMCGTYGYSPELPFCLDCGHQWQWHGRCGPKCSGGDSLMLKAAGLLPF